MIETEAIIERVRKISRKFQHLDLAVEEPLMRIKPGQSLLVRPDERYWNPYLREHWWPVGINKGHLTIERPGSEEYRPGQVVSVLGLVGQPYRFRRTLRNVLLVAHNTAPTPLLLNIPWLLGNQIGVTLVLTGEGTEYETGHINTDVEIIHGENDLTWPNQVMTIGWADQVFVAVSENDEIEQFKMVLERFRDLRAEVPQNYLFGVFRPPIPCGTGACQACMLRVSKSSNLVCTEGPAFDLTQVTIS